MKEVTLVQCTDSKHNTEMEAKDLYMESAYFECMRRWAEARGDPWYILSAKHGLVDPMEVLEPYNQRGLSEAQAEAIAAEIYVRDFSVAHITAGSDYTNDLVPALEARGIDVVNHFAGERIGARRQLLTQAARELENKTLC